MGWRLDRDIGARAIVTASGAGMAWIASSFIGDRRGASTTALLALVGTQLGQTLTSGERSRQVVLTSVVSTLGLAAIVQTPGLSSTFGCRPLGPLGWSIAIAASASATAAGRYAPDFVEGFIRDSEGKDTWISRLLQRKEAEDSESPQLNLTEKIGTAFE